VYHRLRRPSQGKPPTGRAEKWIIVVNDIWSKTFLVAGPGLLPALFDFHAVTVVAVATLDRLCVATGPLVSAFSVKRRN